MKKENFPQPPQSKADHYQRIEEQSKRINFLNNILKVITEDSIISNTIEIEFIDNGFSDLFQLIQKSSKESVILIIQHQLKNEEEIFQNISKSFESN